MRTSLKSGLGSIRRHRKDQAKDIPINVTAAQYRAMKKPARNKYGNKITTVDGEKIASKREAKRYAELKLLEQQGYIFNLRRQTRFPIMINGVKVGTYVCDHDYREGDVFHRVVEDSKGVQTPVFILKWKIMKAMHPNIEWRIV